MYVHLLPPPQSHPFTQPPPPPPPQKKKKKKKKKVFCQIRILCQFIEKYLPLKKMDSLSNKFTYHQPIPPPPPTRPDHTHLHLHPPIYFLIWIICQLDSVPVNFLQTDKKSKYKIIYFLAGVGGWGWGVVGGGRGGAGRV